MRVLRLWRTKIIKLKKELVNFNLLTQERVGLNKPNRLYLLKPNYDIEASLTKELPNSQFQNNEFGSSRTVNLSGQELPNSQSNDTELNNTNYIENEDNDTYDMNDIISNTLINNNHHSNHTNHQKLNLIMTPLSSKYSKNCHKNFKTI